MDAEDLHRDPSRSASDWTVLLSRAAEDDPTVRAFEESLLDQLRAAGRLGGLAMVAGDVYHLAPDAPTWAAITRRPGPLLVLAWRWPRAVYWMLRAAGVAGVRADLDAGGAGRAIHCIDLRGHCCPERVVEKVAAIVPAGAGADVEIRRLEAPIARRWYPVLDASRCTGCLQCPEFCLFGVFEVVDGRPVVAEPSNCKPGCPACSRVCPARAIMFPDYAPGGAIAGSDTGTIEPFRLEDVDVSMLPPECADAVRQGLSGAACACLPPRGSLPRGSGPPARECGCECGTVDEQLDAALEQLETDEL